PRRGPAVQPSRRVAYDVLEAVRESDAYANLLLPSRIEAAHLNSADAAFATELTYGTLRRQGTYDRLLAIDAARPVIDIDPAVLDVLRLGTHQLIGMRVASHAAVGESVELVRQIDAPAAAGFVNGILRTISRRTPEQWNETVLEGLKGPRRLAIEHAHPRWIVDAFSAALAADGRDGSTGTAAGTETSTSTSTDSSTDASDTTADRPTGDTPTSDAPTTTAPSELAALLAADNIPPRVSLVALPGLSTPDELGETARLDDTDAAPVSPLAVRLSGGDPGDVAAVRTGRARVQDEGSQLAALTLSRARDITPGEQWLDMCAGPGGKAALLAAEAARGSATLIANELVPVRAGLVRQSLAAVRPAPEVVVGDGRRFATEAPARFDRILLDAPCSGLGALRRRPEARWRKSADDIPQLVALQSDLLDTAIVALRPGGLLAYVTCSPHPAETREVVAAALARHPHLRTVDTPAVLDGIATRQLELTGGTAAQLWPHRHGTDAMFVQLLTTTDAQASDDAR
ncbi:MAG: transcription antitermination factor NusB, partial [Aeromicrobium sp.]